MAQQKRVCTAEGKQEACGILKASEENVSWRREQSPVPSLDDRLDRTRPEK